MLAFTGCDKFHKTINGLQNEPDIKETVQDKSALKEFINNLSDIKENDIVQDKPEVQEGVKAEYHHTVGDGLYLAVEMGMGFLFTALFIKVYFVCLDHAKHQQ